MLRDVDVVCFFADIGNPVYYPLMNRMCESAKRAMPDCRTVLISPTKNDALWAMFDTRLHLTETEVTADNLCRVRAQATVTWAHATDRTAIYVDPDVVFRRTPILDREADILLSWRRRPDQPVNSGMVIARAGCPEFWQRYGSCAVALPPPLNAWWCDQLAYNLVIGIDHEEGDYIRCFDATVKLIGADIMCAKPEEAREESWSLHYKGAKRKEQSFAKSGDGNSLVERALSTDYVAAQNLASQVDASRFISAAG